MTKLLNHPTVIAHRARREHRDVPIMLDSADLRERCLAAGAHDVGFVDLANPAIDDQVTSFWQRFRARRR